MLDGSLTNLNNFTKVSPYTKVDTANAMPINGPRLVEPVNQNLRSKEYVQNQNIREIYSRNLAPSNNISTEKFLKSKSILSPVFMQNEALCKITYFCTKPPVKYDLTKKVTTPKYGAFASYQQTRKKL